MIQYRVCPSPASSDELIEVQLVVNCVDGTLSIQARCPDRRKFELAFLDREGRLRPRKGLENTPFAGQDGKLRIGDYV